MAKIRELAYEYDAEIKMFVDAMRFKLDKNKHKGKWTGKETEIVIKLLDGEVNELKRAVKRGNLVEILQEAADVANMALIIFNIEVTNASEGMKK